MMLNLFAYGTLMCEDIMEAVTRCCLPSVDGRLKGYVRRKVKRELYPAIVRDEKGEVEGTIYLNLPSEAWMRLDAFEGEMYDRCSVQIEIDFGSVMPAEVYVLKPEYRKDLEAVDWDYEAFLCRDKSTFCKQYGGFHAVLKTDRP